jgi:hypothetical protein
MNAAGRWRLGYLIAVVGGFAFCTLHWSLVSLFQNPCGFSTGPLSTYRDPYFYGGLLFDAGCLLAAIAFGLLFWRAQFRVMHRPYLTGGLGLLGILALAAYQFWFEVVVVQITAYGFCF